MVVTAFVKSRKLPTQYTYTQHKQHTTYAATAEAAVPSLRRTDATGTSSVEYVEMACRTLQAYVMSEPSATTTTATQQEQQHPEQAAEPQQQAQRQATATMAPIPQALGG